MCGGIKFTDFCYMRKFICINISKEYCLGKKKQKTRKREFLKTLKLGNILVILVVLVATARCIATMAWRSSGRTNAELINNLFGKINKNEKNDFIKEIIKLKNI